MLLGGRGWSLYESTRFYVTGVTLRSSPGHPRHFLLEFPIKVRWPMSGRMIPLRKLIFKPIDFRPATLLWHPDAVDLNRDLSQFASFEVLPEFFADWFDLTVPKRQHW